MKMRWSLVYDSTFGGVRVSIMGRQCHTAIPTIGSINVERMEYEEFEV